MLVTHTVGAVLNGGSATRMGSPKGEVELDGVPFIDRAIGTLSLVVSEVVVCGGAYGGSLPLLPDTTRGVGPLAGLRAALDYASGRPVAVCAVDMPLVSIELMRRLSDPQVGRNEVRVAQANGDGTVQPLCGTYGPGAIDVIDTMLTEGLRSVHGLLDRLDVSYVGADDSLIVNINTPDDLERLTTRW
ncbi:MAG: molybdenum cofactor guanylyltransferase [Acidimicrobiia bacterium]|nr:molybdenum cofactor guanylyltransferase [Acidimicrobiia bacterium]